MDTYLAVNLELKVNEKQHHTNSRTSRNNAKTVSSSKQGVKDSSPKLSRY